MNRWIVAGLVMLNVMLGVGAYQRLAERSVKAQIGGGKDVAVVAGINNNQTVVYMLDPGSGKLVALKEDIANKRFTVVAGRDLKEDLKRVR